MRQFRLEQERDALAPETPRDATGREKPLAAELADGFAYCRLEQSSPLRGFFARPLLGV